MLHEGLGSGWPFAAGAAPDTLARSVRPLLTAHAANAGYPTAFRVDAPVAKPTIRQ